MTPQQIKAMKLALEALKTSMYPQQKQLQAITSLEEALAEHAMSEVQRLGQEIEQEPVAWINEHGHIDRGLDAILDPTGWTPLYTTQPQRTWVDLTDEDKNDCLVEADPCECLATPEAQELMRCVAAKLRSKNT